MRVILASASPRRRELLCQVGVEFEVLPATGEETGTASKPWELVEELAACKAGEVFERLKASQEPVTEDFAVLGADTIVVLDGKILGKPKDEKQAFEMLSSLQGRKHQVYSGVAIYHGFPEDTSGTRQSGSSDATLTCYRDANYRQERKCFHVMTEVEVFPMTEAQIASYIATGESVDKAGAYGIQGRFAAYIKGIVGDYYNVVGLPVSRVMRELFS